MDVEEVECFLDGGVYDGYGDLINNICNYLVFVMLGVDDDVNL